MVKAVSPQTKKALKHVSHISGIPHRDDCGKIKDHYRPLGINESSLSVTMTTSGKIPRGTRSHPTVSAQSDELEMSHVVSCRW